MDVAPTRRVRLATVLHNALAWLLPLSFVAASACALIVLSARP